MIFSFRVDSSSIIGMGHLMRCLTLANGLKKRGFECYFICRDFEGNGAQCFIGNDFPLELLSIEGLELNENWLGVPLEKDITDTVDIVAQTPIDWLVIDHYEIDQQWEKEFRAKFPETKIMVIDDLVRAHDCDLLLDQTYGRTEDEYRPIVSESAQLCLGTEFALLREEFIALRSQVQQKPDNNEPHILVTLGGGDQGKPLRTIGKALRELAQKYSFSATVITGDVPDEHLSDYKSIGDNIELISFSNDIAAEMVKADFAIGAGGGTSWERCCLGLPTVVLTIADNQIEISRILHEKEAGISVLIQKNEIFTVVEKLLADTLLLINMSENAASLCDGKGVVRVVDTILSSSFEFRAANISDAKFIYDARYADCAAKFYRNSGVPSFDDHVKWLETALAAKDVNLFCVSLNDNDIGHVRLDRKVLDNKKIDELSIYLAASSKGKKLGKAVLKAALHYFTNLNISMVYAEVHHNNFASINVFEAEGFTRLNSKDSEFIEFLWTKDV